MWYFQGLPNTSPLDHEALKTYEGVNKGGRLDPLPKIFGSAFFNQIVSLAVIFQIIIFVNDLHNSPGSKEKKDLPVPLYLTYLQRNPSVFKPHNIHYHSHNFTSIWLHVVECRVSLDRNFLFCKSHFIFVFALKVGIPWSYGKSWLLPSGNLEYIMQNVYMA